MKFINIEPDSAQVRFPPPLLFIGILLLAILIDWFALLPTRLQGLGIMTSIRWPVGAALVLAGLGILAWAAGLFRRRGNNLPPWQPVAELVINGPYRWTRNPMYLGMALLYAGLAVAFDSLLAIILLAVLVLPIIQTQVIAKEERYLESKFGEPYLAYKKQVGRWL